jgi:hypothetical protein
MRRGPMLPGVTPEQAVETWDTDGFAVLPAFLPAAELAPAVAELGLLFPAADEFHGSRDDDRTARFADEFGGIDEFPFASVELSLLAVHPSLVALAAALLRTDRLRVYSIEAWAKYTGAADYDQEHHRDYLSHTLLVPSQDIRFQPVEMFVYLVDVPPELGAPAFVPRRYTQGLPAIPNWFPRTPNPAVDDTPAPWRSTHDHPELYETEVTADGPAGTVVAYRNDTLHRATAMSAPGGVRYTIHVNFRPAGVDWIARHSWQKEANSSRWHNFVARATPEQLALFGFPPPGHPYWTAATIGATAERYPDLDLTPWQSAVNASAADRSSGPTR